MAKTSKCSHCGAEVHRSIMTTEFVLNIYECNGWSDTNRTGEVQEYCPKKECDHTAARFINTIKTLSQRCHRLHVENMQLKVKADAEKASSHCFKEAGKMPETVETVDKKQGEIRRVWPFSCGTQRAEWIARNCCDCTKYDGDDIRRSACDIDKALGEAFMTNGSVSEEIARRMGYSEGLNMWVCPERVAEEADDYQGIRGGQGRTGKEVADRTDATLVTLAVLTGIGILIAFFKAIS